MDQPTNNQEFLGVDVGAARVGIARGASIAKLAEPVKTVPAADGVAELQNLAQQNSAVAIVVGIPRSLDGNETNQTKSVRDWVSNAKDHIKLPFYWQDEALTSQLAGQGTDNDARAAAIILQDFLNSPQNERVIA